MAIGQATTRFRVLLIDPPYVTGGYNVGLAYLASSARHAGHEVAVLDLNSAPAGAMDKIKHAVKDKDYVGISVHSFSAQHSARETAKHVKK